MTAVTEIRTIVIPVDGSEHAHNAAMIGAAIAARFGARVVLLHVLLRDTPLEKIKRLAESLGVPPETVERLGHAAPAVYDFGLAIPANMINPVAPMGLVAEIAQRILDREKAAIASRGVESVACRIADGDAAERIVETAKLEEAGLIVMGRRGLGAIHGLLVGSVSTKVGHMTSVAIVSVT